MHNTAHSLVRQKQARPSSTHVDAPPHQSNHRTENERPGSLRLRGRRVSGDKHTSRRYCVGSHHRTPPATAAAVLGRSTRRTNNAPKQVCASHVEMWLACRDDGRDGPIESCKVPERNQHPPGRSTKSLQHTPHGQYPLYPQCSLWAQPEAVGALFRTATGRALVANRLLWVLAACRRPIALAANAHTCTQARWVRRWGRRGHDAQADTYQSSLAPKAGSVSGMRKSRGSVRSAPLPAGAWPQQQSSNGYA